MNGQPGLSGIAVTSDGFTVDAVVIAAGFALDPARVPEMLRAGQITSRCEKGIDEDAGRFRLTFYHGPRALRLIVDAQGVILKRARFPVADRRQDRQHQPPVKQLP